MQREWDDVKARHAAKPLLDELAEVAKDAWFEKPSSAPEAWRRLALAIARRLLSKPVTEEEVRDAVKTHKDNSGLSGYATAGMAAALRASRRAQLAELEERA